MNVWLATSNSRSRGTNAWKNDSLPNRCPCRFTTIEWG
jgi:hypothetical protein